MALGHRRLGHQRWDSTTWALRGQKFPSRQKWARTRAERDRLVRGLHARYVELRASVASAARAVARAVGSGLHRGMRTPLLLLAVVEAIHGDEGPAENSCVWANDGTCDYELANCAPGTDETDCDHLPPPSTPPVFSPPPPPPSTPSDSCVWANDGTCDYFTRDCAPGTDSSDCDHLPPPSPPPPPTPAPPSLSPLPSPSPSPPQPSPSPFPPPPSTEWTYSDCKCAGVTNPNGAGGASCSSFFEGKPYCFVANDVDSACADRVPSNTKPSHDWSYAACVQFEQGVDARAIEVSGFQCHDGANSVFTQLRASYHGRAAFASDARDTHGYFLSWTSGAGSGVDACANSGVGCWFIDSDGDDFAFPMYLLSAKDEPPLGPDQNGRRGWNEYCNGNWVHPYVNLFDHMIQDSSTRCEYTACVETCGTDRSRWSRPACVSCCEQEPFYRPVPPPPPPPPPPCETTELVESHRVPVSARCQRCVDSLGPDDDAHDVCVLGHATVAQGKLLILCVCVFACVIACCGGLKAMAGTGRSKGELVPSSDGGEP